MRVWSEDKGARRQIGEPPTSELVSNLDTRELARFIRQRLYDDRDYARIRRTDWRRKSTITWGCATLASAAATVILGLADLGTLASIGFVLSALVTSINAVEPFFNWRSRWVGAEEALASWHRIEESLALYVASTPEAELDRDQVVAYDREREIIWRTFAKDWLAARRGSTDQRS